MKKLLLKIKFAFLNYLYKSKFNRKNFFVGLVIMLLAIFAINFIGVGIVMNDTPREEYFRERTLFPEFEDVELRKELDRSAEKMLWKEQIETKMSGIRLFTGVFMFIVSLFLTTKRLNDLEMSYLWNILLLVPVFNLFFVFYLALKK